MGFLDNTTITVDAILTRKGREKLASFGSFDIVYYAFADDEIDYNLYDVTHPQGSTYYGAVLENMPLLESFVDETQVMRYKLFTNENKDLNTLSYVTVGGRTTAGNNETITPSQPISWINLKLEEKIVWNSLILDLSHQKLSFFPTIFLRIDKVPILYLLLGATVSSG